MKIILLFVLTAISINCIAKSDNSRLSGLSVYSPQAYKKYTPKDGIVAKMPADFNVIAAMHEPKLAKGSRCVLAFFADDSLAITEKGETPIVLLMNENQSKKLIPLPIYQYSHNLLPGNTYFSVKMPCAIFQEKYNNLEFFYRKAGRLTKLPLPNALYNWFSGFTLATPRQAS